MLNSRSRSRSSKTPQNSKTKSPNPILTSPLKSKSRKKRPPFQYTPDPSPSKNPLKKSKTPQKPEITEKKILKKQVKKPLKDYLSSLRKTLYINNTFCQVCFTYIDPLIARKCSICKSHFHSECCLNPPTSELFICGLCLESHNDPSYRKKVLCDICHTGIKRSMILHKITQEKWIHMSCLMLSPKYLIENYGYPIKIQRNIAETENNQKDLIPCSLCYKPSEIKDLMKCSKCHEFAHYICILRDRAYKSIDFNKSESLDHTNYIVEPVGAWTVQNSSIPDPEIIKSVLSKARGVLEITLKNHFPEIISIIFNDKDINEVFDEDDWLKNTLNNLKNSMFSSKDNEEFMGILGSKIEKFKAFCPKHIENKSGCCSKAWVSKKNLKCFICQRIFHMKCLGILIESPNQPFICPDCLKWQSNKSKSIENWLELIPNEGISLPLDEILRVMCLFSQKVQNIASKKSIGFDEIKLILMSSSAFVFDCSHQLINLLIKYLESAFTQRFFTIERVNTLKELIQSLRNRDLSEYNKINERNQAIFNEFKFFLDFLSNNEVFLLYKKEYNIYSAVLSVQKAYFLCKNNEKIPLEVINDYIKSRESLNFHKLVPESQELDDFIVEYQRILLEIEEKMAQKEVELKQLREEIKAIVDKPYQDSISIENYENFLGDAISSYRTYFRGLWKKEELLAFIEKIHNLPFELKNHKIMKNLHLAINYADSYESQIKSTKAYDKLGLFYEIIEKNSVFLQGYEGLCEFYSKYKLWRKKIEIFLIFDSKIELNSFLLVPTTKVYENLLDYVLDIVDLNEIPIIKDNSLNISINLYELLSLENIEKLMEEGKSLGFSIIPEEPNAENGVLTENTENFNKSNDILNEKPKFIEKSIISSLKSAIQSKKIERLTHDITLILTELENKHHNAIVLLSLLQELLDKKPKELACKITLNDLKGFLIKNNIFLPIFERFYEKKLEKLDEDMSILSRKLKPISNRPVEEVQRTEQILLENYLRESSQEIFEIKALNRYNEALLQKLEFHYNIYKKLNLSQKKPREFNILMCFNNLYDFLQSLSRLIDSLITIKASEVSSSNLYQQLSRYKKETFEKIFFKSELRNQDLIELQRLNSLIEGSCLGLSDPMIKEKIMLYRIFFWLKETETLLSQTKGLPLSKLYYFKGYLDDIVKDFDEQAKTILVKYPPYNDFINYYKRFDEWMRTYNEGIAGHLAFEEKIDEEEFFGLIRNLKFLREEYKKLNLEFELGLKRIEDFEVLAQGAKISKGLYEQFKGNLGRKGLEVHGIKVLNEFERNTPISKLFPYYEKIRETHTYYQNISQEIIEMKKTFNEKKLKFSKYIVLQLHSKDSNLIMTDHITFFPSLYQDYELKIKSYEKIQEMLIVLATIRFNIRNYKDLLRQSAGMTETFIVTIQKLVLEKGLEILKFDNALDILSLIVTLRNDVIRKPLFFCKEILEFACYEWSFNAKCLLEGLISFNPEAELLDFLKKVYNEKKSIRNQNNKDSPENIIDAEISNEIEQQNDSKLKENEENLNNNKDNINIDQASNNENNKEIINNNEENIINEENHVIDNEENHIIDNEVNPIMNNDENINNEENKENKENLNNIEGSLNNNIEDNISINDSKILFNNKENTEKNVINLSMVNDNNEPMKKKTNNAKPNFLINDISVWEDIVEAGMKFHEKFQECDGYDEGLLPQMQQRLHNLDGIRGSIRQIKTLKTFLLENIDDFFESFPKKSHEFKAKRKILLEESPDIGLLIKNILESRVFLKEELEFLMDLEKKQLEIDKSLAIIRINIKKNVEKQASRIIPYELILNIFKTLYSSPFHSDFEEVLEGLVLMIRHFESKTNEIKTTLNENSNLIDGTSILNLLNFYDKNPLYFPSLEGYFSDYKEFLYLQKKVHMEMDDEINDNYATNTLDTNEDIIEIEEQPFQTLSYNWQDVEALEKKIAKQAFFKEIPGFLILEMEFWRRKSRIIEQISWNIKPTIFVSFSREELKELLKKGTILIKKYDESLKNTFNNNEQSQIDRNRFLESLSFLKKYVKKANDEVIRLGKQVLLDPTIKPKIKETSQMFNKIIDISKEISLITTMNEPELNGYLRRIEAGLDENLLIDANENKEAHQQLHKPQETVITQKSQAVNSKTFQSIFTKNKPSTTVNKPKGRAKKQEIATNETEDGVIEDFPNKSFILDENLLDVFKTRRPDNKEELELIERERNRSIDLISQILKDNGYLPPGYNEKWASSRLETQIYKHHNAINDAYRRDMIKVMDILSYLKKKSALTEELLGDERMIRVDIILDVEINKNFDDENDGNNEEEKKNDEMEIEGDEQEFHIEALMEKIQGEYWRDRKKREIWIEDDERN